MRALPYRTRLTLAYTAIVAVAVILLGTVAFITVRLTLDAALVNRLQTTALAIRSVVDVKHGRVKALDHEDRVQFLSILGGGVDGLAQRSDGSVVASNLAAPPQAIRALAGSAVMRRGDVRLKDGVVTYVALPIDEDGAHYGTLLAWQSRNTYDDAVRSTLFALLVAGLCVIAAAAAAGGTIARRMLQPVTDLSEMISDIEATSLSERIAWEGPDDELGRLCLTFDRLLDRLETAFDRERRFTADASHELRTPLSVLRAEVELALNHERTPEVYRETLLRLQREIKRLETLAESLLLTARHDAGMGVQSDVSLELLVEAATSRMQPLALQRNIVLSHDARTDARVNADPALVERAIVALIDNALRFARPAGNVLVDTDKGDVFASISVIDDGEGFSDDALREATTRFWRDDEARSGSGTGLGLSIVRSIVERHGGTIELHNSPSGGAVAKLMLPLAQVGAAAV
jgi:two-component system OmpR family sensor kinase